MAPFSGIAKVLRSMSRKATRSRSRSSKPDTPITDDEAPSHLEKNVKSPGSPGISIDASHVELESILVEEVPKTPSNLKYDFQDPTGPPGQLYRGEFKELRKHGSGTMSFAQNDREARFMYKGNFVDDKMHGSGVLDWHDGKTYKGQFENNHLHGEGVMIWPDGRKYIGHYVKGRKHGPGTVHYPNGCSYCGKFLRGKMHGEVVYTNQHGLDKLVLFRLGKPLQTSVLGEGAGASDTTTDISSVYGGSVTTSGTDVGAGLISMLDDMCDGERLGDDDVEKL